MIAKIVGAAIGERIGERFGGGGRGALIGAISPVVARRLFGPLGLVLVGGYAAKKYLDYRRSQSSRRGRFTP